MRSPDMPNTWGSPREQAGPDPVPVDELSGFVTACALIRPTGIEGMKVKSVRKKLKQPSFAAKVDREQIARGIDELGVEEGEHIAIVIEALAARAEALGLTAAEVGSEREPE